MFETIKRLYAKTKNKTIVENAVLKRWISKDDYRKITGEALMTDEDLGEGSYLTEMYYNSESESEVVECIRKRMAAGEDLRDIIDEMNLSDSEKWALEKRVKEG